ncbi:hypothetical protein [Cellulomonas cellasea]|uniref:Uncharacterized protein n=1 Tax=Cellulomonas cellasea TaxID=43670 RepID=A0A7W4UJW1_9CELL|nr:hypothetical protein [Cellulomonas cellasea]MBB2925501.1 hypothetical protein [Cellulomonas cellasea]
MKKLLLVLVVAWIVLSVVGAVIEGLLWLSVVALILLAATTVYGWVTSRGAAARR